MLCLELGSLVTAAHRVCLTARRHRGDGVEGGRDAALSESDTAVRPTPSQRRSESGFTHIHTYARSSFCMNLRFANEPHHLSFAPSSL